MRPMFIVTHYPAVDSPLHLPGRIKPLFVIRPEPRRRLSLSSPCGTTPKTSIVNRVVTGFSVFTAALLVMMGFLMVFCGCAGGRKAPLLAAPEMILERSSVTDESIPLGSQTIHCLPTNNGRLDVDGGYFDVAAEVPHWSCRASGANGTYQGREVLSGYTQPAAFLQFDWVGLPPPSSLAWLSTGKQKSVADVAGGRETQELVNLQAAW